MLRAELIEGSGNIAALQRQWGVVYRADPEANYFLSYPWLFGTPEGAGKFGFVVGVQDDATGEYVAFLPIRINTEIDSGIFHNELNLCGNYNSDYTGLICKPGLEAQAIPLLASKLVEIRWRRLRLLNFAASQERALLFLETFDDEVFETKNLSLLNPDGTDNSICPYAQLGSDWTEFLTTKVGSNTRQKIRRFLRRIEDSDEYRIVDTSEDTVEQDIETLIRLWSDRWGKIKGKRLGAIQTSFRRMLRHAFETGTLYMPTLLHHGEVVCMHGIFVDREKSAYNFYVGARDQAFSKLPSGLVLHGYAMRKAISEQIEKYDFLRGDEPYKYAFGANESRIQSVLISSKSGTNLGEKLDPRSWAYVKRRSREFLRNQDSDASRRALVQILEADPGDLSSQYLAGLVEAIDGDDGKAIEAFASVVSSSPNSLKAWYRLGRALAAHYENWNDASAAYSFLLKQPTDQRHVPLLLGRVLQRLGQFDLALAVWESALMRDPGNQELRRAVNSATSRVGGRDPMMNRRAHSTFGGAGPQQKKTSDKPGLLEDQIAGT